MRVIWIALLIALLPLRGWVGDAMAVAMIPASAVPAMPMAPAADPDCPQHASAEAGPAAHADDAATHANPTSHASHSAQTTDHGNAGAHLMCDVCNGPALDAAAPALPLRAAPPSGLLVERTQRFSSLAPRQLVKPPIA